MSIFEDLIEELKEENLLEETVIKVDRGAAANGAAASGAAASGAQSNGAQSNGAQSNGSAPSPAATVAADEFSYFSTPDAEHAFLMNSAKAGESDIYSSDEYTLQNAPSGERPSSPTEAAALPEVAVAGSFARVGARGPAAPAEADGEKANDKEYFRKRAMDEVTGLQMVEHVLSGVERDQLKIVPIPYDDLPVKLALHDFMQIAAETNASEHAQAEFRLMQETENWYSSLSHRDRHLTVGNLRRFCETTKPALSSHALLALARFYRNSPYTELVRSKFDLIATRLFAQLVEDEKREVLLTREEIIFQLKELYAEWSSIQLYSPADEDAELLAFVKKFEEFAREAENARSFDDLISNDFFNRWRALKESCQENFFAPVVVAAAVDSNVKIGNRYIDLLEKERENASVNHLEEKYGFLHDSLISDVTGKTYQLAELLKLRGEAKKGKAQLVDIKVKSESYKAYPSKKKQKGFLRGTNKWLIGLNVLTLVVCGSLYFWAQLQEPEIKTSAAVQKVNFENTTLKNYLQTARISDEIFYGITQGSWDDLAGEKKEELLKNVLAAGAEKGYKKVQLINAAGKTVGYASAEKVEVFTR